MTAALLDVRGLTVRFGDRARPVVALDACDLTVDRGEIVGLVGESGSGKSTLARVVAGLIPAGDEAVLFDGTDLARLRGKARRMARRRIGMVFQDPDTSLNPHHRVRRALAEPLVVSGLRRRAAIDARVDELAAMVRLDQALLERRPRELSGGQKQRVAIARALAMSPALLIADEALAALDVANQAAIRDLLAELRDRLGLAILFISHDLGMVAHLADHIVVLRDGTIVESGDAKRVLADPTHAYTRALVAATPDLARGGLDLDVLDDEHLHLTLTSDGAPR